MVPPICIMSSGLGFRRPSVAATPDDTPMIPRALPTRLVFWDDKPVSAPTQQRDAAKYAIWWMSG